MRSATKITARSLSSVAAKLPAAGFPPPPQPPFYIDLSDTRRLFASVPTSALLRSLATLSAMASGPLVDLAAAALRSSVPKERRLLRAAVLTAARATVHRHFCAGEQVEDAARTVRAMWTDAGLRSILDYGMEDADDAAACDRNLAGFLRAVDMASSLPPTSTSVCVKMTALAPISLLERASDALRWEQQNPSFRPVAWRSHSFPVLCASSPLHLTPTEPHPLTETEENDLQLAARRLSAICQRCAQADIPLLIDAEYSSVQPAIDYLTYWAALKFNHGDRPTVYGTIQTYLRDSRERMMNAAEGAAAAGVSLGVKLVRGAYLSRETRLAAAMAAPSPLHGSIQETHRCFNDCASFMIERVSRGAAAVVVATHNLQSAQAAALKAQELGIGKEDERVKFAQLMGMANGLSYGLRNAGFQVSKYLPFGPVEQVIPYLLRRAEENRGLLSASAADRQLMRKELSRRLAVAIAGRD
ncbi:proline dehydrogenase 1, mitochondrial-like [Zingiber officinale]|uniref:proline dehydrogenase 1, mitochondrial-like n=1 Tax=Zingiber officinale TaxID=94328 RepID=UPI001C4D2B84|nr:proline dehydrogenase 1, mitochondrial-like [Zingiber officinale]